MFDLIIYCVVLLAWVFNLAALVVSISRREFFWSLVFSVMAVWGYSCLNEMTNTLVGRL